MGATSVRRHPHRDRQRRYFLAALVDGLEAFAANDYTTWYQIVELTNLPGGREMLRDIESDPSRKRLLQDFSALYRLCGEMDVLDDFAFDWSTVSIANA